MLIKHRKQDGGNLHGEAVPGMEGLECSNKDNDDDKTNLALTVSSPRYSNTDDCSQEAQQHFEKCVVEKRQCNCHEIIIQYFRDRIPESLEHGVQLSSDVCINMWIILP